MKIEQEKIVKPVTITLENADEINMFGDILHFVDELTSPNAEYNKELEPLTRQMVIDMFDKLNEMVS